MSESHSFFKGLFIALLISCLLWICAFAACAQEAYKVTPAKVGIWLGYGVAGSMWGAREAFHADPTVFERRWNVGEKSFFGSQSWQRQYEGNTYFDGARHKPEAFNTFRDYWHFSGTFSRTIWLGGTFTLGASKQRLKHRLIDLGIGLAVSAISGNLTYKYFRR